MRRRISFDTQSESIMQCFSLSGFVPELGLLCCDDAHLQLRGLEVDGENSRQTRDGRLFMGDMGHDN